MAWTANKPTTVAWYWYRDFSVYFNMGKPMPAWVYEFKGLIYAYLSAVHSASVVKNVNDCAGVWAGPIEPAASE
jgi:hypothetical protein